MPARQLHLFPPAKPLTTLYSKEFFRSIPRAPGVYIMTGKEDRVIYVGQSRDLRTRLATYKNCNRNQLTRKVVRLIHEVEKIAWETCESALHARLRENALLRLYRPRFNVVNVFPQRYAFVGLENPDANLALALTTKPQESGEYYGAFKGLARQAFGGLIRCLWTTLHNPISLEQFPCGLLSASAPKGFRFHEVCPRWRSEVVPFLRAFLRGESEDLTSWIESCLASLSGASTFQRQLHEADVEVLRAFFESGPKRNRRLREANRLGNQWILQDQLDDLIVSNRSEPFSAPA